MAKTKERDKSQWIVQGQYRNNPWVMFVIVALIIAAVVIAYIRIMGFGTVTYEVRQCQSPITAESSWTEIEAADCSAIDAARDGVTMTLFEGKSPKEVDSVRGGRFVFEGFPINTPAHSFELRGVQPAEVGLLVDPSSKTVRRELSSNASGTDWSGFTGARGPTDYWVLLAPGS